MRQFSEHVKHVPVVGVKIRKSGRVNGRLPLIGPFDTVQCSDWLMLLNGVIRLVGSCMTTSICEEAARIGPRKMINGAK